MTDGSNAPGSGAPEQRPPGWQPPAEPRSTWATPGQPPPPPYGYPPPPPYGQQPPPYGYQPPLYQARPVYKPGTIPLRPLGVGDFFSGSIETIRRNPKATIGVAAVVLTAFMLVPILGTLAWGAVQGFTSRVTDSSTADGITAADLGVLISTVGGTLLSWLATVVLTGMIVHVVEHAARGQKLSAADAWTLTRPRVWRLVGLSLLTPLVPLVVVWLPLGLLVLVAFLAAPTAGWILLVLGGLTGLALTVYLYTRWFQLAAASLVVEQRGCFSAMRRSWELSRGQFWRIFGITLLTGIVAGVAGSFLTVPFQLVSAIGPAIWPDTLLGVLVAVLGQNVALIISGALTTPFSSSVSALLYLDQRIRKEGYDIQLIAQVSMPPQPAPR